MMLVSVEIRNYLKFGFTSGQEFGLHLAMAEP